MGLLHVRCLIQLIHRSCLQKRVVLAYYRSQSHRYYSPGHLLHQQTMACPVYDLDR